MWATCECQTRAKPVEAWLKDEMSVQAMVSWQVEQLEVAKAEPAVE